MSTLTDSSHQLWAAVIERGLNAHSIPLGQDSVISVFRRGPFGVGYVDFPFGIRTRSAVHQLMRKEVRHTLRKSGVDLLRLSAPEDLIDHDDLPHSVSSLPETVIKNLEHWSLANLASSLRYEVRRASREGIQVRDAAACDARKIFELYRNTVKKHGGHVRYTHQYFKTLLSFSSSDGPLRISVADTADADCVGFIVSIRRESAAYYLHGGFDPAHAKARPGYALLDYHIRLAAESGCSEFNMMASPPKQTDLIRFKEKWGGSTSFVHHWDIPFTRMGKLTRLLLQLH